MPDDDITLFGSAPGAVADAAAAPSPSEAASEAGLPDFSFLQFDKAQALASLEVLYQPIWNLKH